MTTDDKVQTKIKVTVTCSLSPKPPFRDQFEASATVLEVRQAAMAHFGISEDPSTSVYYLVFHRDRQADSVVLGILAGDARAVEFRLAKEAIQG